MDSVKPSVLSAYEDLEHACQTVKFDKLTLLLVPSSNSVTNELALSCLDSAETDRANRLTCPVRRRQFILGRFCTKKVLQAFNASKDILPSISLGPHGKPFLPRGTVNPHVEFSISHAGELTLLAFSTAGPIGVDISKCVDLPDLNLVANQIMSPAELQEWCVLETSLRVTSFYNFWTRTEAALKLLGTGFSDSTAIKGLQIRYRKICLPASYVGWIADFNSNHDQTR